MGCCRLTLVFAEEDVTIEKFEADEFDVAVVESAAAAV
jgi:hypothetical protein